QAHRLPSDEQHQVVVAKDQEQHREHEQVQVGEEPPHPPVAVHVADGVNVDQEAHGADHQQQHRGQLVDLERYVYVEAACHDPLVERHVVRVPAEDHAGEYDHAEDPGDPHQHDRHD